MRMRIVEVCMYGIYACMAAIALKYDISPEAVAIFTMVLFMDMIIGSWKSIILHGTSVFSWGIFIRGMVTKVLLFGVICMVIIVTKFAMGGDNYISKIIMPLFITATAMGVLHNMAQIYQKKELPEWDAVSRGLERVKTLMRSRIEKA